MRLAGLDVRRKDYSLFEYMAVGRTESSRSRPLAKKIPELYEA